MKDFAYWLCHKEGKYMDSLFNAQFLSAWIKYPWIGGETMSDNFGSYIAGGEI